MNIEICKWYNNAKSPVLLMIDDLANTWVDTNNSGSLDLGEDWGYFKNQENSSFRYLNDVILKCFANIKVTFFVPVGVRVGILENPLFCQISLPMNADEESKQFFKSIHENPNFELAYHGITHGEVGKQAADFVQEWATFMTLEEAKNTINEGISIFHDAVGVKPRGGKYCGYTGNAFSDESIDQSGFSWWFRYWNRGTSDGERQNDICGQDKNPLTNFDVKRFGSNQVIDIPSTVNGALLNGALNPMNLSIKGIVKGIFKKSFIRWKLREIDYLLQHHLVISVQEHIAPSRDDGKRQSPNIFDDQGSLIGIFRYLEDKNVWYCTGSELADYVNLRDHVNVISVKEDIFRLEHPDQYSDQVITLKFSEHAPFRIIQPNKIHIHVNEGFVNLPVMKGDYLIVKGGI